MFAHHTNRCPDEYAKMNDKQTYTFETFTLIREIRQRENDEPIIVATLVIYSFGLLQLPYLF